MKPIALIALFIGAAIGLYFPDIDRVFPFLLHRSGITHSVLIPFAVLWLTRQQRPEWLRAGLIGVCVTLAVHLSFDLPPVLWMGYRLISLPVISQIDTACQTTGQSRNFRSGNFGLPGSSPHDHYDHNDTCDACYEHQG